MSTIIVISPPTLPPPPKNPQNTQKERAADQKHQEEIGHRTAAYNVALQHINEALAEGATIQIIENV